MKQPYCYKPMDNLTLIQLAKKAAEHSYSPYSGFKVGAALLCTDGTVYLGCNIENISFGATNCAERTAIFSAVADGKKSFLKIAIVGTKDGKNYIITPPCGICRQVMSEFCENHFEIILTDNNTTRVIYLKDILSLPFDSF